MAHSRIEIKSSEDGLLTELKIDGNVIHSVRSVEYKKNAMNPFPTLTIDLNALDISIDSYAVVRQKGYEHSEITLIDGDSIFCN